VGAGLGDVVVDQELSAGRVAPRQRRIPAGGAADDRLRHPRDRHLPGDRLRGRLLRGQVRREAKTALPGAPDRALLHQLPDEDAVLGRAPAAKRLCEQRAVVPSHHAASDQLAGRGAVHPRDGAWVRLHSLPGLAALRVPRQDRPEPARGGARSWSEPLPDVRPGDSAAVEAGDTGQPGDRHLAHVRRLLHEQPALGLPENHDVRESARQRHGDDRAGPRGSRPCPVPGPFPDDPDAVLHAADREGAERPMSETVSARPAAGRRRDEPALLAPSRNTRTPLGWWRNPWRRPYILATVTWVYLAWSLLPVLIAIGISFSAGR